MVFNERRKHQRYDYITSGVKIKGQSQMAYNPALMVNYSEGGMYLKTNESMAVGQGVTIKMDRSQKDTTSPEKFQFYNGRVKRMEQQGSQTNGYIFEYGIEYNMPVDFFK